MTSNDINKHAYTLAPLNSRLSALSLDRAMISLQTQAFQFFKRIVSRFFILSVCIFSFNQGDAQVLSYSRNALEVKGAVGMSFFLGDLGGSQGGRKDGFFDFDIQSIRGNGSVGLKFNFSNRIALRSDFSFAQVFGSDKFSEDAGRRSRNLSFKSNIYELTLAPEIVLINLSSFGRNKMATSEIYVFGGFGFMRYNPKAELNGVWYELQPLGTEGQGLATGRELYSLQASIVPFGMGYRHNIGEKTYIGVELSMRKSYTDYIDDVSTTYYDVALLAQNRGPIAAALSDRKLDGPASPYSGRGNPNNNDNYAFIQITFSRSIGKIEANASVIGQFLTSLRAKDKCPDF